MAVDAMNTKFSDVDLTFVKEYLHIEPDFTEDDTQIAFFIEAAKALVIERSAMTVDELDNAKFASIVYLKLISDFYQNRTATGDGKLEPIFDMILKDLKNYTNFFGTPEETVWA